MKIIGIIGGMSPESTVEYYKAINRLTNQRLGGMHSAKILIYSIDFGELKAMQGAGKDSEQAALLTDAANRLEAAGADILLITANTKHKYAGDVSRSVNIPLIHIAEVTGEAVVSRNITKVGLLGTLPTMEEDFYIKILQEKFGLEVLIPDREQRQAIDRVIFDELVKGEFLDGSRQEFLEMIRSLAERGAEGIILGCTEIPLLIKQEDSSLPLFNTLELHAARAVELAQE